MIIIISTYIIVALVSYSFLIGRSYGKKGAFNTRKLLFSLMWPIHAMIEYFRMVGRWDDGDSDVK